MLLGDAKYRPCVSIIFAQHKQRLVVVEVTAQMAEKKLDWPDWGNGNYTHHYLKKYKLGLAQLTNTFF